MREALECLAQALETRAALLRFVAVTPEERKALGAEVEVPLNKAQAARKLAERFA